MSEAIPTQLTLTADEQAMLVQLLETEMKNARIEEHRTRTPSYRQHIVQREDVIQSLLTKLGATTPAA